MREKETRHEEANTKEGRRMENTGRREENGRRDKKRREGKVAARERWEQTENEQNGDG